MSAGCVSKWIDIQRVDGEEISTMPERFCSMLDNVCPMFRFVNEGSMACMIRPGAGDLRGMLNGIGMLLNRSIRSNLVWTMN